MRPLVVQEARRAPQPAERLDGPRALDAEPAISDDETAYLLEVLAKAFPSLALGPQDVISTWSGVRPVIDTGKADPSKESREHAIWREEGLLTITGGKLLNSFILGQLTAT